MKLFSMRAILCVALAMSGFEGQIALAAATTAAPVPASAWRPVLVTIASGGGAPQQALGSLMSAGFHPNSPNPTPIAGGGYAVSGVAPYSALERVRDGAVPGVGAIYDLSRLPAGTPGAEPSGYGDSGAIGEGGMGVDWDGMMEKRAHLLEHLRQLQGRRQVLQMRQYMHTVHALTGEMGYDERSGAATHPNALAAQTREQIERIDAELKELRGRISTETRAIAERRRRLEEEALDRLASGAGLGVLAWEPPAGVGDAMPQKIPASVPGPQEVKGIPTPVWTWFQGQGFELSQEPGKLLRILGRWTGREVDYEKFGLSIAWKDGSAVFSRRSSPIGREEMIRRLQIAEIASLEAPRAAALDAEEQAAAEAGRVLFAWGVPAHIMNNSQEVVTVQTAAGKQKVSLTPDAKFYSYKQGVPLATKTGALLLQLLKKLEAEEPGRAGRLTPIELQGLAYLIDRQLKPWWEFDPKGAMRVMDQLHRMLADGRIVKPVLDDPIGIDPSRPVADADMASYWRESDAQLRARLAVVIRADAPLQEQHELAMAARFAWTQLAPSGTREEAFRTIVHRDGLSFLKATEWRRARMVWSCMPLGEMVARLGLDPILAYLVQNGIKGQPMAVADAGWVDIFHPDVSHAQPIFRDGDPLSWDRFFMAAQAKTPSKPDDADDFTSKRNTGNKAGDFGAKAGPVQRGAEVSRIDDHATAIASILELGAAALNTTLFSIDLPGFSGDQDVVPPGVNEDDFFFTELSRAMLAAIERHGVKFFNFSWGGGLGGRALHKFLDDVSARFGVKIVAAAGNSGPGFSQETAPTFGSAVTSVGATDGLGKSSDFTSGGGFMLAEDGQVLFTPQLSTIGGAVMANSRLASIPENPDASQIYLFEPKGDFIHIRGTSFSSPIMVLVLNLLTAATRHAVDGALRGRGVSQAAAAGYLETLSTAIDQAVKDALIDTAEMLPGISAVYIGRGEIRPAAAFEKLMGTAASLADRAFGR